MASKLIYQDHTKETGSPLVSSTDASGTVVVKRSDKWQKYQFAVTLTGSPPFSGSGNGVFVEWSAVDSGRWVKAAEMMTDTNTFFIDGSYPEMRIRWAGLSGSITVDMIRFDEESGDG